MEKFLERLALVLAAGALTFNHYLGGTFEGFAYGASVMCDYVYSPYIDGMWMSGLDPYLPLGNSSIHFLWAILPFFILKLFERGWVTSLAILLSPFAALLVWFIRATVLDKYVDDSEKYFELLRQTVQLPRIVLGFLLATILVQALVVALKLHRGRKKREAS